MLLLCRSGAVGLSGSLLRKDRPTLRRWVSLSCVCGGSGVAVVVTAACACLSCALLPPGCIFIVINDVVVGPPLPPPAVPFDEDETSALPPPPPAVPFDEDETSAATYLAASTDRKYRYPSHCVPSAPRSNAWQPRLIWSIVPTSEHA